ncbi:MAG TPA: protein kinase [Gemmatimonadaceae bacterium]|nr:protein kinase [Gemmatimonadaceae bacterium]
MELRDRLQSTLGNAYSVERELGGGGMSRVFLAQEIALGRNVVVKVLSGEITAGLSSERFAREVRLAASLQHPNIVPVLTTGSADGIPYYTMPYVKGESLRARMKETGTLSRRHAISILRDVARALQYAHTEGVIHRDIKPENVLLSGDAAVVTDFGIAKAISVARTSATDQTESESGYTLTQAGSAVGTPAYMAPEQVAGDSIDHRADLYAWGLLAYEVLSGVHPFAGKTSAVQLLGAQLSQIPAPLADKIPDLSPQIASVVMRCLSKSPDERPASAAELLDDLEITADTHDRQRVTRPSVPARAGSRRYRLAAIALAVVALVAVGVYAYSMKSSKAALPSSATSSVAVLPFADDRADSANAYFGEGIADELMTALGKVPGLRVASRTSAIALGRRRDLDVREIGRLLGVAAVVEGTVRRAGGQLRVTAQLTSASDGLTLWSEAYEREDKDVFAVQDTITQAIVAALRPELAGGGTTPANNAHSGPGTTNVKAYDLYLRGLYLLERRGAGVAQSAEYFSQAIKMDPRFARAFAGLASALEFFPYFANTPPTQVEARVRAAAEQSLKLDPTLAEPRVALAMADWHAFRWTEAEAAFRRAIAADSTAAVAHTQYGRYLISIARIPDAIRELRIARRLDPFAPTASVWLARALGYAGDRAAAMEEVKRARELDPNIVTTRTVVVFDIVAAGRLDEARSIIAGTNPNVPFNGMTAHLYEVLGDKTRAAALRGELDSTPDTTWMIHTGRAYAYLATADTARVLSELESGIAQGEMIPQYLPLVDRIFDKVRQTPRFAAVVRKAGLEGRGLTGPNGGRPAP